MITERKIDSCKTGEIKIEGQAKRIVNKGLMSVPHTLNVIARKGGGKTTCLVRLYRAYQKGKHPAFDFNNVFVLSCTYSMDAKQQLIKAPEDNIYDTQTDMNGALADIMDKIQESLDEYEEYEDKMEAWRLFKEWDGPLELFPSEELLKIYDPFTETIKKPTTDYIHGRPSSLIYIDDAAGSGFLSDTTGNGILTNFIIKSRHYNCSCWIVSQHYKNIGRAIRGNASCLLLFKTQDESVLKEVQKEVGGDISKEDFMKVYSHATKKPFDFLLIDLASNKDKFRKNFNTVLSV
tara:strand:+ start:674 stop:1549 length:876 start_codon:yes stop_codon:yes gene_type:complete